MFLRLNISPRLRLVFIINICIWILLIFQRTDPRCRRLYRLNAFRFGDTGSCSSFCFSTVSGKQCIARGRLYWFCHEFLSAMLLVSTFLLKFPNLLWLVELKKQFMFINYVPLAIRLLFCAVRFHYFSNQYKLIFIECIIFP